MAVAKSRAIGRSWTDLVATARAPSPDTVAVLAIAGIVVLANFLYWSGLFDPNPLGRSSGLGYFAGLFDPNPIGAWGGPNPGLLVGAPMIDPSNGQASQALGHLAALDWTHLRLPWWNPYEGTGMPLAGEMQAGALFPPTLLLLIGNGQVYEYLLLELVAGISTYFLLRRISRGPVGERRGRDRVRAERHVRVVLTCSRKSSRVPTPAAAWHRDRVCREHRRPARRVVVDRGCPRAVDLRRLSETAYIDGLLAVLWFGWRCGCAGRQSAPRVRDEGSSRRHRRRLACGAGARRIRGLHRPRRPGPPCK